MLKDRFRNICRTRHLSLSTERSYWAWVARYIKAQNIQNEAGLIANAEQKFSNFISGIAPNVSSSTQNQAWNALIFLYRDVLNTSLGRIPNAMKAKRHPRIRPVPASHEETIKLIESVPGNNGLALRLIYGCAMRIKECLRLRVKDLDFANNQIAIYDGKSGDAFVPMPLKLKSELQRLVRDREIIFLKDKLKKEHWVWLPDSLGIKYPKLHHSFNWQFIFSSERISQDPRSGRYGRHHISPEAIQQAMAKACEGMNLKQRFTPHSLRHAGARFAEKNGTQISEIQRWLRHKDVETTLRYLGIGEQRCAKVVGPLG